METELGYVPLVIVTKGVGDFVESGGPQPVKDTKISR